MIPCMCFFVLCKKQKKQIKYYNISVCVFAMDLFLGSVYYKHIKNLFGDSLKLRKQPPTTMAQHHTLPCIIGFGTVIAACGRKFAQSHLYCQFAVSLKGMAKLLCSWFRNPANHLGCKKPCK